MTIPNTRQRAALLDPANIDALLELVRLELGHPEILDGFQPYGDLRSQALAPGTILHIVSGNTPEAGRQSLTRGLLLGSLNRVKIPSSGLPALEGFIDSLPPELRALVETSSTLTHDWLESADAVIVFGSDETVADLRRRMTSRQIFLPHGHKLSFAIVFADPDGDAAERAARDVSLFDQKGCLSPQNIYVAGDARAFAGGLATAMEAFNAHTPRGPVTTEEAAEIFHLRSAYRFRAANDPEVAMWECQDGTGWTVVYEEETQFAPSCLNRFVFVKPLPVDFPDALRMVRPHLSAIALHPFDESNTAAVAKLGASRLCPLGSAQSPSLFWHQDGGQSLAPLVRWIDAG